MVDANRFGHPFPTNSCGISKLLVLSWPLWLTQHSMFAGASSGFMRTFWPFPSVIQTPNSLHSQTVFQICENPTFSVGDLGLLLPWWAWAICSALSNMKNVTKLLKMSEAELTDGCIHSFTEYSDCKSIYFSISWSPYIWYMCIIISLLFYKICTIIQLKSFQWVWQHK